MTYVETAASPASVLDGVRRATRDAHARLEDRLDALGQLADPRRRPDLIRRYAAFYIPADAALFPHLGNVEGLAFASRSRAGFLQGFAGAGPLPAFPRPRSRAEALGLLYVLEGSSLGGRMLLRALADRGVEDPALAFLDPYGADTGALWRGFLTVLERDAGWQPGGGVAAATGAVRGFAHAEELLCRVRA